MRKPKLRREIESNFSIEFAGVSRWSHFANREKKRPSSRSYYFNGKKNPAALVVFRTGTCTGLICSRSWLVSPPPLALPAREHPSRNAPGGSCRWWQGTVGCPWIIMIHSDRYLDEVKRLPGFAWTPGAREQRESRRLEERNQQADGGFVPRRTRV